MLKSLVTQFGVPFRHNGANICEFGTVSTVFTKPYVPMQLSISISDAEPLFETPPRFDEINTPCLHRINYFKTDTGVTLFVDFTAAQYGNLPGVDSASCLPFVLMVGESEANTRGYGIRMQSFLPISDTRHAERLRNYFQSCASHMQESILHLRGALFRHVVQCRSLDLPALMKAHPEHQPPPFVACSRLQPDKLFVHINVDL